MSDENARVVDEIARAVDGVVGVYSARPLVSRAARQLIAADTPLSLWEERSGTTTVTTTATVTVSVGVSAERGSAETAERVAAAVRSGFAQPLRVVVRVSRVVAPWAEVEG